MSTPDTIVNLTVNGIPVEVPAGTTAIAALIAAGTFRTRRSVTGQLRFAVCGIGQCQECRVSIDGKANVLACRALCKQGMQIVTGENV